MKPILFNTDMVTAILEGRKTETRQFIKPQPIDCKSFFDIETDSSTSNVVFLGLANERMLTAFVKPKYQVGDILWVRETWKVYKKAVGKRKDYKVVKFYGYKADENDGNNPSEFYEGKWRPSIHMPREAARIFLKVNNIRVERVQDIRPSGVVREGLCEAFMPTDNMISKFAKLWDSIYGNWNENPWVFAYEFERVVRE